MAESEKRAHPGRIVLVIVSVTLWGALILARLVHLQLLQHNALSLSALRHQQLTRSVIAPRGVIYDSHMDELASSVTVNSVAAEPRRIRDLPGTARRLAPILGMEPEELQARMTDPSHRMFLM